MSVDVSILIPTHNRRDLLRQTLESLRGVRLVPGLRVELIVVANACSDDTAGVVESMAGTMPFPTRCVVEQQPGSSRARNRGIDEAAGSVLAFLDDDVLVNEGWLEAVHETFEREAADLVFGRVELWWKDVERPEWFTPELEAVLARKDHGDEVRELTRFSDAVSANLAMRRRVIDRIGGFRLELERRGERMGSCEDTEFLARAQQAGLRMFYSPRAEVLHYVDPRRVSRHYLCGTAFGNGRSGIFRKPRFGVRQVSRALAGHLWLATSSTALAGAARLRGETRALWRHRLRRSIGLGGLAGSWQRLTGGGNR